MTKTRNTFLALVAVLLSPMAANADLILHVSPDGAGTRWQFLGSAVAGAPSTVNSFWGENSGTLVNAFLGSYDVLTGTGNIGSTSDPVNAVINTWASQHNFDGLSVRASFGDQVSWNAGDLLFWSGDVTSALPFAGLNLGTVVANNILFGVPLAEGVLRITVSETALSAAVPEPGTLALLGLGLLGMGLSRRRKA